MQCNGTKPTSVVSASFGLGSKGKFTLGYNINASGTRVLARDQGK